MVGEVNELTDIVIKEPQTDINKSDNRRTINIKVVLESLFWTYTYVIIIFFISDFSIERLIYSFLHATLAGLLLGSILSKMEKSSNDDKFSLASITLLITVFYFQLSSIKYVRDSAYLEFLIDSEPKRFIISIIGGLIIGISIEIWWRLNRKRTVKIDAQRYKVNNLYFWIGLAIYIFSQNDIYSINYIPIYLRSEILLKSSMEQFFDVIITTMQYFLIFVSVINIQRGKIRTYIPLVVLLGLFIINASITGHRSALAIPIIAIFYSLLLFKRIEFYWFRELILIAPIGTILVSLVVFIISGRYGDVAINTIVQDLSYRFDLSDYPLALIEQLNYFWIDLDIIFDGIVMIIPSLFYENKLDYFALSAKEVLLNGTNLQYVDFTDTFFSMGTEFFGIIGYFILYPLFIYFFEKADYLFSKNNELELCLKYGFCSVFIVIEIEWWMFIPAIRNAFLASVLFYFIFKICRNIDRTN